jgi:antirestriction protein ArdC
MASTQTFAALLAQAVSEPGIISKAYTAFHNYSIGNQLLAWSQCIERGIAPGPIATFPRWKALGRYVRKSEHAKVLCMPVTCRRTVDDTANDADTATATFTRFVFKPHWFVLAQTDGQDVEPTPIPD